MQRGGAELAGQGFLVDAAGEHHAADHHRDQGEGPLARKDGSLLWCRALARAVNPEAPLESAIVVFSDVTERHAAEQALRRSEALYRSLVETSNDLVWSTDLDGRWTYVNPAAVQRIYECSATDLVGTPAHELAAPGLRERDAAVFARVLAGEPVFRHETRHQRRDGSAVDLSFNAVPLRDAHGAVTRRRVVLAAADDDGIEIEIDGARERVAYDDIVAGHTVFDWGPAPKPGTSAKRGKASKASKARSKPTVPARG